ncbi:condensin subunit Smc [Formivibrio citricus]|uniref:Chromosome partition protein Smc n=1 Tax=Formivibrio citricus TaxID=83765 RepID=A0A1I4WBI2_9NEIS|nr:chromosome segregation protein SMC [Formivibrio citricus]SFN10723.1 condensin subunit Smc [Formivibrio citricus]
MRLSHIKLAGFKSFVDPTTIATQGQLVAVCGPNGCGKSNVIDAVRWVLGESSAKQLRGESMQDVIFNGSSTRKAVSRASVELVFDNSAGLAAGQWSQYAEIAIKRVLTRQGESSYYINNLQVRRRDITDLFLGTGVGKGGYAIIEQGMISRIIEAKPEELRHYLEEAAGVSKYKERRRETENRIADTRDNLARVDDIRLELDGQIEKLSTQAEVAAEYHRFKEAIAEKQNLLALQRKVDASREAEAARHAIDTAQNALEGKVAELRTLEAEIETLRETHYAASDAVHNAQAELYDANAGVARLEQQLLHLRQTRERINGQVAEARGEIVRLQGNHAETLAEQEAWQVRQEEAQFASEEAALALEEESQRLPELEDELRAADAAFQTARDHLSQSRSAAQLAQQQLQHHERTLATLKQRHERLLADRERLADDAVDPQLEALALEREEIALAAEEVAQQVCTLEAQIETGRIEQQRARSENERLALEQAGLTARIGALQNLLIAGDEGALDGWLRAQGLSDAPRVFELIEVASGWETALEAVLGMRLQGRVTDALPGEAAPASAVVVGSFVGQLEKLDSSLRGNDGQDALLRDHVVSSHPAVAAALSDWLSHVYCAQPGELETLRRSLPAGAWLVTPEGHLASRNSVHYHAGSGSLAGLVACRRELGECETRLAEVDPLLAEAKVAAQAAGEQLGRLEATLRVTRREQLEMQQKLAQTEREHSRRQEMALQSERRRGEVEEELLSVVGMLEEETAAKLECEEALQLATEETAPLAEALENARLARAEIEAACELQRSKLRQAERHAQEARFAVQAAEARLRELAQRDGEFAHRQEMLTERLETLLVELDGIDEGDFDVDFQAAVDKRSEKERALAAARDALNGAQNQLREREAAKQLLETTLEPAREAVNAQRLKEQEARLAVERFAQELAEAGVDEEALRPLLGSGLKISSLVGEIGRLTQAINGLGAVNLAALEELTSARERKTYLDSQAADLLTAMETLENAIRRIDRETRALLSETFNAVNGSLQELFPTLFGGGHAELILTGEEILDAGLQIMAQPPGKKNSTIHLLSGGEKALTALSLVFSLFRLNPAPFCLLDEVDAPLDDANTLRYCDLVKKMSERTQFLFISHNRLAMEMAQHLVGVTMQEQGVSRVVAVDVEQALSMREPATV